MGSYTGYLNLFRPAGSDVPDPSADVDANMLILDDFAENHSHTGTGTEGEQLSKASLSDAGSPNGLATLSAGGVVVQAPAAHRASHLAGDGTDVPGVRFAQAKRTAGNYVLNKASNTTWYELDSTNLRKTVKAAVGDLVVVRLHGEWFNEAVTACVDVASVVSGSPVNYWGAAGGTGDFGIPSLVGPASVLMPFCCDIGRVVVSGDLSSGQITVSPFVRLGTASANKTLFAASTVPLFFAVENKGPVTAP